MSNTRRTAATVAAVLGTAVLAVGCHGGSASSAASAAATSTALATAKADAATYFAKCIPVGAAGQVKLAASLGGKPGREELMECAGVPKQDRAAAEACVLGNAEHGGKLPKGTEAKLDALLADAYPCAEKYRAASAATSAAGKP